MYDVWEYGCCMVYGMYALYALYALYAHTLA